MNDLLNTLGAAMRPDLPALPTMTDAGTLAGAAQPFAKLLHSHHADERDETPLFGICGDVITVGDLRRLHAALAPFGGVR